MPEAGVAPPDTRRTFPGLLLRMALMVLLGVGIGAGAYWLILERQTEDGYRGAVTQTALGRWEAAVGQLTVLQQSRPNYRDVPARLEAARSEVARLNSTPRTL